MALNKMRIRKQIVKAIQKLPSEVELRRVEKVGPIYSYTEEEVTVATFDCFLDRSESDVKSGVSLTTEASEVKIAAKIGIITVWLDTFEIREGDFFYLDGLKHVIVYPKNNYDIYWDCDIEVVMNG